MSLDNPNTEQATRTVSSEGDLQRRLSRYFRRYPRRLYQLELVPALFWVFFFLGASLLFIVYYSFLPTAPPETFHFNLTLQNYQEFFSTNFYMGVLWSSFVIAVKVTAVTVAIAYPVAYFLAFHVHGKRKYFYLVLVILPFWMNLVIRTYAWRLILSNNGVIPYFLVDLLGLVESTPNLLFTQNAVVVGLVHVFLPYMLLPIYTNLDRIETSHVEAAKNLGANKLEAFYEVTLPQSLPGVTAGVVIVFVLAFGSFLTPILLGGNKHIMIANIVGQMFRQLNDWPLGSAIALVFLTISLLTVYVFNRLVGLEQLYSGEGGDAQ